MLGTGGSEGVLIQYVLQISGEKIIINLMRGGQKNDCHLDDKPLTTGRLASVCYTVFSYIPALTQP